MPLVSITRLRLRTWRFLPGFLLHAWKTSTQTRLAEGYVEGSVLRDRNLTFWTMTIWRAEEDMRRYMTNGAHARAMPKLKEWCDEASVVHWTEDQTAMPNWDEAERRMRRDGRPSKVRKPSRDHQAMTYLSPRTSTAVSLRPTGK